MREIKFRCWDGKNMHFNQFMISAYGNINKVEPAIEFHSWKNEDWILMQYTGIKDREGKDIYEGDIIKVKIGDAEYTRTVKFDSTRPYLGFHESGMLLCNSNEYFEIIGNVYENPDIFK